MMFIGNINYVLVAVVGGLRVAVRRACRSATCRRSSSTRGSSASRSPRWRAWPTCCSPGSPRPSGCSQLLDAEEQAPDPVEPARPEPVRGRVAFEDVSFRYEPDRPLIEDLSLSAEPGQTVAIVGPDRRRQDHAGQPAHALLRGDRRPDHPRRRGHRHDDAARSCARTSAWCCRTPGCSAAPSPRTSPTAPTTRPASRIVAAAQAAHVDRFVRTLPDGYDTVIDEEGVERQRGREAADHHRPGVPGRAGHPHPGRGDQLGGHPHRGADPAGDELAAVGPDELRHRPPALHDPRRGRRSW